MLWKTKVTIQRKNHECGNHRWRFHCNLFSWLNMFPLLSRYSASDPVWLLTVHGRGFPRRRRKHLLQVTAQCSESVHVLRCWRASVAGSWHILIWINNSAVFLCPTIIINYILKSAEYKFGNNPTTNNKTIRISIVKMLHPVGTNQLLCTYWPLLAIGTLVDYFIKINNKLWIVKGFFFLNLDKNPNMIKVFTCYF